NMMERNPLYSYTSEGKCGVVFRHCQDCTIQGLHLHNVIDSPAGLVLDQCDWIHIDGCTILDCDNAGVLIRLPQENTFHDMLVAERRQGRKLVRVRIVDADGNVVEEK